MKEKQDLLNRIEDEQKKVFELKDQLLLKEIALQKSIKEEIILPANDGELEFRLKEYKSEINDLKSQIKQKDNNISKQDSIIKNLRLDIKSEKRNNESLLTEIEVTGNAYEEALKKCKTLCAQLQFSEQNYNQLMNERIKEENWKSILEKKQKTLEETVEAKENVVIQLQEIIQEQEKIANGRMETINILDAKFKALEQKFFLMNSTQVEANKKIEEMIACKKEIQEKLRQSERFCIKSATDCMQFKFLYENCLKGYKELEESIANQKDSFIERNMDLEYIAEIAKYRELIRCSQCRTRNKDCLLTKCLHMYCRKCIELNLSQKKRKCPACYTKFSSDDVRSFCWS
jgi:E3 ubiquitin-protein ligase BRE1